MTWNSLFPCSEVEQPRRYVSRLQRGVALYRALARVDSDATTLR